MKPRVLLIEDDDSILLALSDKLAFEGYDVVTETAGDTGWARIQQEPFDLLLLDVMLPELDGIEICRRMREAGMTTPVLMLSARGLESDRVLGLEIGADDYLTKPFSVRECTARIGALLRRRRMDREEGRESERVALDRLEIDFDNFSLTKDGTEQSLSPTERDMLRLLVSHRGEVVSREKFLNEVWGFENYITTRTVDFHIRRLRLKIEDDPHAPLWIKTVHGVGYRFDTP